MHPIQLPNQMDSKQLTGVPTILRHSLDAIDRTILISLLKTGGSTVIFHVLFFRSIYTGGLNVILKFLVTTWPKKGSAHVGRG